MPLPFPVIAPTERHLWSASWKCVIEEDVLTADVADDADKRFLSDVFGASGSVATLEILKTLPIRESSSAIIRVIRGLKSDILLPWSAVSSD